MNKERTLRGDILIMPMRLDNFVDVMEIQNSNYLSGLRETREVLSAKFSLCSQSCWVVMEGTKTLAYLISHPWVFKYPPELNTVLKCLPERPDCYYIHDIAISQNYMGLGLGRRLLDRVIDLARVLGFKMITLVAVNESSEFWSKMGFIDCNDNDSVLNAILRHYGPRAQFMMKII